MKNLFVLLFLLLALTVKSYSQGYFYQVVDSTEYGRMRLRIEMFKSIFDDFVNVQQQIALPLSYREEAERRRKEEEARFNKMINDKRKEAFENIIGMTEAESAQFWPVYNEYDRKLNEIIAKRQTAVEKLNNIYSLLTEEQANVWADVYVNSFDEEASLMKQYRSKFKAILGRKKLPFLYRAEYQFKEWIIRTIL